MIRVLAAVLALLILVEGSGLARAFSGGETIDCCCGRHDAHRACKCPSCPVSKKRKQAATSGLDHARDCDGHDEPGVLAVVAVARPVLPSLLPPAAVAVHGAEIQSLSGRLVEAGRPPP